MATKILHIADPHIDSPLKGLARYPGLPDDQIRGATRRAFENAVQFALRERVDLVLIAGDLFDGAWRDMGTGLWAVDQFHRLRAADISVALIRGNHDALSKVAPRLDWPDNVYEFASDKAECWRLESIGVAVHGQSFGHQAESRDLAAEYPAAAASLFNIGLLHTSLAGSPEHDTYAPTSVEVLNDKGYDYWALGHIHQRSIIETSAPICYAGNLQGRHIRETGPKGAVLLNVHDGNLISSEFVPFDVVRWASADVTPHVDDSVDDIVAKIEIRIAEEAQEADGRPVALRANVSGMVACHDDLAGVGRQAEFEAAVRAMARDHEGVWIEKVRVSTSPPIDIDQLTNSDGLLAALFEDFTRLRSDNAELAERNIQDLFAPLFSLATRKDVSLRECGVDFGDQDDHRRWLAEAEAALLSSLAGDADL